MGEIMAPSEPAGSRSYIVHNNEYPFKGPLFTGRMNGRKYEADTKGKVGGGGGQLGYI
jgi:hypothetical protein